MSPNRTASLIVPILLAAAAPACNDAERACGGGEISVFASGLLAPTKVIVTSRRNLLVSEGGTPQPDTGRVSLIAADGSVRVLLEGLPSALSPEGSPSGPSGLVLVDRTLYLSIAEGDSRMFDATGAEVANPAAGTLLASLLEVTLEADFETNAATYALTAADRARLADGDSVTLRSGSQEATVRVLANFPNTISDPFAGVRASSPFALDADGTYVYIADSAQDSIRRVDRTTGQVVDRFATFAPYPNPLPFGPPLSDAVPTSAVLFRGELLVSFLTGFPFNAGRAEVRRVDLASGTHDVLLSGLTTATDVRPGRTAGRTTEYFALNFSTDFLADRPGELVRFDEAGSSVSRVIAEDLVGASGMARDPRDGDIFITNLFAGLIVRVPGCVAEQ